MISKIKGWQHVTEVFGLLSTNFSNCFQEDNDVSVKELYIGIKKTMTAVYETCTGVSRRPGGQCVRAVQGYQDFFIAHSRLLIKFKKTFTFGISKKKREKKNNFLKTSMRARSLKLNDWESKPGQHSFFGKCPCLLLPQVYMNIQVSQIYMNSVYE